MRALREAAYFLLFLALAVAFTWPLGIRLPTAVPDLGDPLLNTWIIDWVAHALVRQPLDVFDAPIFHPAELPLAYSENLIGVAIFAIPLQLAGVSPIAVYNVLLLLGFAHAGYGAFVLSRLVTRAVLPSILGGIFFAFVSYKFDQLSHLQMIWSGWLPLLLAALIAYWWRPSIGRAAMLFGAFVMNGLTNIHFLLFGGVALVVAIVVLAAFEPRRQWRFWLQLGGSLVLSGVVLLPVLLPYRYVADLYKMTRHRDEVAAFSAEPEHWLHATTRSRIYGPYQPRDIRNELTLFPGLVSLFLVGAAILITHGARATPPALRAAVPRDRLRIPLLVLDVLILYGAVQAIVRRMNVALVAVLIVIFIRLLIRFPAVLGGDRGRSLRTAVADSRFTPAAWAAATWIVLGFLGSLGTNAFLHNFLFDRVPAFAAIRVPARWAVITYAGMAVWAALGAKALIERRRFAAFVLPLFVIADVVPVIHWQHAPVAVPPFYRWLNETRIGPVLELPPDPDSTVLYLLYAAHHHVPLMNGASGFEPPPHRVITETHDQHTFDARFTRFLENAGAKLVVVHGDTLSHRTEAVLDWLEQEIAAGRIRFLRRFDNGVWGDWVFAISRNLPDWPVYRDFGSPERLQRFLAGQPTYNNRTFGVMEIPRPYDEQTRELRVSGWALSPHGIRSATALIDNGRLRIPMQQYQRPDVVSLLPWYPKVPAPGLYATVPKRPKGTPRMTDVQIEIVDGAGNVTLLRDVPFRWN